MGSHPKKLQIYLSDELFYLVENEAKTKGVNIAAVVRESLTEHLKNKKKVKPEDPIWKIPEISNSYVSHSQGDLSLKHDEYLYGRKE